MSASSLPTSAHPNQEFSTILQLGLKASNLAILHQPALTPRLPPAILSTLIADLDHLGVVVPSAKQIRHEAKVATSEQTAALDAGYARVKAVRTAVKKARASKEVKQAYGVGQVVKANLVRDVKAVLKQILDRASANPDEAASVGIVKKDLDAMTAAHQAITDADMSQEHKRATAPLSTQERNRIANRILDAVARISGAGGLEFAGEPELLAAFTALKPSPRKKGAAKKPPSIDETPLPPVALPEPLKKTG